MVSSSISIYTPTLLALYDVAVHGISNPVIWRCPTAKLIQLYSNYGGHVHLDVGVGTGYLLGRSSWRVPLEHLVCLDANRASLVSAARNLRRYRPELCLADACVSLPFAPRSFESIGCTYLLHCLPIPFAHKLDLLVHLGTLLQPGGVLFGATILGRGVHHSAQARMLLRLYNALGIFSTADDDRKTLEQALQQRFRQSCVHVQGSVALFTVHA